MKPHRTDFRFAACSLLAGLFAIALAVPGSLYGQSVAYTGATLITMGPAGTIENGTLVVRDGKLVAVGADVDIPGDARRVSLSGMTVVPGLIDPYFVYRQSSSTETRTVTFQGRTFTIPGGGSFSAGAFIEIGKYFYPFEFDFRPAFRSGITVGNLVSDGRGLSAFANLLPEPSPEMLFQQEGFLFAQTTNQTSALDVVRNPLKPTPQRGGGRGGASRSPASGFDAKPFWDAVREGEAPLFVNTNNSASIAYLLGLLDEFKKMKLVLVATGPTLYPSLDQIAENPRVTVVLQPGLDQVPNTADLMNVSSLLAEKKIPFAISMSLINSQLRASQDDPFFPLAMLVKTGLDRDSALQAVTMKPASLMGIEKTHGSLETDKQANFLVFDGDPLKTGSRLVEVIINGNEIDE